MAARSLRQAQRRRSGNTDAMLSARLIRIAVRMFRQWQRKRAAP